MNDQKGEFISIEAFVAATMTQLMRGILDASGEATKMGGLVNPHVFERQEDFDQPGPNIKDTRVLSAIEFDLAIVPIPASKGAPAGIADGAATIGVACGGVPEGEIVSRIKFRVPVRFPFGKGLRRYRITRGIRKLDSAAEQLEVNR